MAVRTRAAAPDCVECPEVYVGNAGVTMYGGKDSTYQALTLLDLGADVTVVTATTCHLTEIGRANIENLARYAKTIQVTPNRTVRAKLNRMGFVLVGDVSWPEHVAIFTTPFRIASVLGISLIFYGESPQNQYGGPIGTEEANKLTRRWRSEFGGFLGLRPSDLVGQEGITERISGKAGQTYDTLEDLKEVVHLDKLGDAHAVLLVKAGESYNLKTIGLP